MEEQGKKRLSIIFVVIAFIIAGIVISRMFSGGPDIPSGEYKMYLSCQSCGELEITKSEFLKINHGMPPGMGGPSMLKCPECGSRECKVATKCKKCEHVFVPAMRPGFPMASDKCPKCGYSAAEEQRRGTSN